MPELDPNIILKAFATPQLDVPALLERRYQIQQRTQKDQRSEAEYQQKQQMAAQEQERRQQAGGMAAKGNYAGAQQSALEAGDFDLHGTISKLEAGQREQVQRRLGSAAPLAVQMLQIPDPGRRAAMLHDAAPALINSGWTQEEIAGFQPTDDKLRALIANAQEVGDALKLFNQQQEAYTLAPGSDRYVGTEKIASGREPFHAVNTPAGGTSTVYGAPGSVSGGAIDTPATGATGAQIEQAALAAAPGATVTSGARSPGHNKAVGGVAGSYHLTDQARDLVPPPGMSMAQLHASVKAAMPGFDVINEGDHVHIEPGKGAPRANAAPSGPTVIRGQPKASGGGQSGFRILSEAEATEKGLDPKRVWQVSPKGEIKNVVGQGQALSANQRNTVTGKLANLRAIDDQLGRVQTAMDAVEKSGFTGYVSGRVPGALDSESAVFDKAVATLTSLVRQITRTPGEGAMSDYESRLAAAIPPSRTDNAAGRKEAMETLRALVKNLRGGYDEMIGTKAGAASAGGNNPPARAVAMLRGNPGLRAQFDAKYGAGAAAKVLGK